MALSKFSLVLFNFCLFALIFPFNNFSWVFLYFSKTINFSIKVLNLSWLLLIAFNIKFISSSVKTDKALAFSSSVISFFCLLFILFLLLFWTFIILLGRDFWYLELFLFFIDWDLLVSVLILGRVNSLSIFLSFNLFFDSFLFFSSIIKALSALSNLIFNIFINKYSVSNTYFIF